MAADRETFLALVNRHGAGALGMLRRLCGNMHVAEDVFQEVTVRVWKHSGERPRLRDDRAWLLTVAYRAYLDHRARRPPANLPLFDDDVAPARSGTDRDPVAIAERAGRARRVNEAVAELPPPLREVVVLHYTGGSRCGRSPRRRAPRSARSRAGSMPGWSNCGGDCHEHPMRGGRGRAGHRGADPTLAGAEARRPLRPMRRGPGSTSANRRGAGRRPPADLRPATALGRGRRGRDQGGDVGGVAVPAGPGRGIGRGGPRRRRGSVRNPPDGSQTGPAGHRGWPDGRQGGEAP